MQELDLVPPTWFYIMILVDAIIAFVIPVWVWWKQLQKDHRIKLFTKLLRKHMLDPFKEDIMKELKEELAKICSNDIPHAVEEQMKLAEVRINDIIQDNLEEVRVDLKNMHDNFITQTNELKTALYRDLGTKGAKAKSVKQQERLLIKAYILENNIQPYANILSGASLFGISTGEINKMLDMAKFKIAKDIKEKGGNLNGSEESPLSVLQAGSWLQEIPSLQTQSQPEESNMGQVDPSKLEELLKRKEEEYKSSLNARGDDKGCQEKSEMEVRKDEEMSE